MVMAAFKQALHRAMPCPCRVREADSLTYDKCCGVWHAGLKDSRFPETAEQLMRSRYTAYALAQKNDSLGHDMLRYLLATWHSATSPGELEISPRQWIGLDVLHSQTSGEAAIVEFCAWFKDQGRATRMHERSRFIRLNQRWLYLDSKEDGHGV